LKKRGAASFDFDHLQSLTAEQSAKTVLIAQDAFTTFYEPEVALATYDLLTSLGRNVVFLPYRENGKALHVKGFVGWFHKVARKNAAFYRRVATLEIPIVGIEPAVTLTYRDEYLHDLGDEGKGYTVQLLQEYLLEHVGSLRSEWKRENPEDAPAYRLFGHCTERTFEPASQEMWREVFESFGARVSIEATGCCGMCGVFGHERDHVDESRGIFEMSWKSHLPENAQERSRVMVTGHSCRSQVKRFADFAARHPAQILLEHVER